MIKKYFAKTLLFLIFTFVFPCFIIAEGFIENKGQFLSSVIAKKNVFGGALFIEKAKLTYCFYNQEQLKNFIIKLVRSQILIYMLILLILLMLIKI